MRSSERIELRKAIRHLESSECEWEDAMTILHRLAGWSYKDWRAVKGKPIGVVELAAQQTPTATARPDHPAPNRPGVVPYNTLGGS
jgi:hypothetical protein